MIRKTITAVTTSRADYGVFRPVLRRIANASDLDLELMVTGSHLAPLYGHTVEQIEADGFRIRDRIETLLANDSPYAVAQSMGLTMLGFAQAYARAKPELLLVLGDRYEMFAAAAAAVPMKIPIAHIHGGETTEGAIDEAFRHGLTKMSHLHFAATEEYRDRILQLGEQPNRVIVSGAPSLDNLNDLKLLSQEELEQRLSFSLEQPFLLVTFHPVTLQYEEAASQFQQLLVALEQFNTRVVFTYPNADTSGQVIIRMIESYVAKHDNAVAVTTLGTQAYFSLMKLAHAMVGNSSSGIIEAASFHLPVVNIGIRQQGRVRGANVIDCDVVAADILSSLRLACSTNFHRSISGMANPYGDGRAAERIVTRLSQLELNEHLLHKKFHDIAAAHTQTNYAAVA